MDIQLQCPQCTERFAVPDSMRGGVANCPKCRKLVEVESAPEFVFWGAVGCAAFAILAISGLVALFVSPWWGGISAAVGLTILAGAVMWM